MWIAKKNNNNTCQVKSTRILFAYAHIHQVYYSMCVSPSLPHPSGLGIHHLEYPPDPAGPTPGTPPAPSAQVHQRADDG